MVPLALIIVLVKIHAVPPYIYPPRAAAEVGARSGHEGSKGADEGEMGDRAAVGGGSDDGQRGGDTGHGDDDDEGLRAGGADGGAEGATKKKRKRKKKKKTARNAGHTGANEPRHHRERRQQEKPLPNPEAASLVLPPAPAT